MSDNDPDFAHFVGLYGRRFPYNAIRRTRHCFHVKWLLLEGPKATYMTLPSACLNKETQMHLLLTRQAVPATKEMDDIIDYMESWGRVEDPVWHRQVINWLGFICKHGIKRDHLGLVYDCVAFRVRRLINLQVGTTPTSWPLTRRAITGWSSFFMAEWKRSSDFVALKKSSVQYVLAELPNPIPNVPSV